MFSNIEFILYVADQQKSRDFYKAVLAMDPVTDVPGMTEFVLKDGIKLGLMPESGIAKIICPKLKNPSAASGIPRCELYLMVTDPEHCYQKALAAGANPVSELAERNWGHLVAYCSDPDGHVIAFAKASEE